MRHKNHNRRRPQGSSHSKEKLSHNKIMIHSGVSPPVITARFQSPEVPIPFILTLGVGEQMTP